MYKNYTKRIKKLEKELQSLINKNTDIFTNAKKGTQLYRIDKQKIYQYTTNIQKSVIAFKLTGITEHFVNGELRHTYYRGEHEKYKDNTPLLQFFVNDINFDRYFVFKDKNLALKVATIERELSLLNWYKLVLGKIEEQNEDIREVKQIVDEFEKYLSKE